MKYFYIKYNYITLLFAFLTLAPPTSPTIPYVSLLHSQIDNYLIFI